jgi:hypothetical protein
MKVNCKDGKVNIEVSEEYREELKDIETDIVTIFIDLTERGMEDDEAKKVILELISDIIGEV